MRDSGWDWDVSVPFAMASDSGDSIEGAWTDPTRATCPRLHATASSKQQAVRATNHCDDRTNGRSNLINLGSPFLNSSPATPSPIGLMREGLEGSIISYITNLYNLCQFTEAGACVKHSHSDMPREPRNIAPDVKREVGSNDGTWRGHCEQRAVVRERRIMDKFRVRVQGTPFVRLLVGEEAEEECLSIVHRCPCSL